MLCTGDIRPLGSCGCFFVRTVKRPTLCWLLATVLCCTAAHFTPRCFTFGLCLYFFFCTRKCSACGCLNTALLFCALRGCTGRAGWQALLSQRRAIESHTTGEPGGLTTVFNS